MSDFPVKRDDIRQCRVADSPPPAVEDWGPAILERRVAEAWRPFREWTAGWLGVIRRSGFAAVEETYLELLEGGVDPKAAHVISLDS